MTPEAISTIRDILFPSSGDVMCQSYSIMSEDMDELFSRYSLINWNDTNEYVTAIMVNNNSYTQIDSPFEINLIDYSRIKGFKIQVTADQLKSLVTKLAALSQNQKDYLDKWVKMYDANHNLAASETRPYFKKEPKLAPANHLPKADPTLTTGDTVFDQGGFDN